MITFKSIAFSMLLIGSACTSAEQAGESTSEGALSTISPTIIECMLGKDVKKLFDTIDKATTLMRNFDNNAPGDGAILGTSPCNIGQLAEIVFRTDNTQLVFRDLDCDNSVDIIDFVDPRTGQCLRVGQSMFGKYFQNGRVDSEGHLTKKGTLSQSTFENALKKELEESAPTGSSSDAVLSNVAAGMACMFP